MSYRIGICRGEECLKSQTVHREIENLYSVLYRGTEHFSLARPFRIAWEGRLALFYGISLWI